MNIDIPAEYLEVVNTIAARSGQTTEEVINSGVRLLVMIHCIPPEDQIDLKSILNKTYPDVKLKGQH